MRLRRDRVLVWADVVDLDDTRLEHPSEHQVKIGPDDGEDRLALQIVEVVNRRIRRHLQRKRIAAAYDGDRNNGIGTGQRTNARCRTKGAKLQLAGRDALQHTQEYGERQELCVD